MNKIIAPTLFHNKICRLPGIGTLKMVSNAAESDFVNSRINAPFETIDFTPVESGDDFFNEFSAFSELLQTKLDEKGNYLLNGIGTFVKANDGEISFNPFRLDATFTPAISVERVVRQDAAHAILVGDQETTNVEMTEYFSEQPSPKDLWWVWALIFGLIGISILVFFYYQHGFLSSGNVNKF